MECIVDTKVFTRLAGPAKSCRAQRVENTGGEQGSQAVKLLSILAEPSLRSGHDTELKTPCFAWLPQPTQAPLSWGTGLSLFFAGLQQAHVFDRSVTYEYVNSNKSDGTQQTVQRLNDLRVSAENAMYSLRPLALHAVDGLHYDQTDAERLTTHGLQINHR